MSDRILASSDKREKEEVVTAEVLRPQHKTSVGISSGCCDGKRPVASQSEEEAVGLGTSPPDPQDGRQPPIDSRTKRAAMP